MVKDRYLGPRVLMKTVQEINVDDARMCCLRMQETLSMCIDGKENDDLLEQWINTPNTLNTPVRSL